MASDSCAGSSPVCGTNINNFKFNKIMILLENNYGNLRCPYCDSIMKIESSDINTNYDNELYVVCPVCNSNIWVTDNVVIKRIKDGILYHK